MRLPSILAMFSFACGLAAQSTYALFETPALSLQPPDRYRAQLATDEVRNRVLLVGGLAPGGQVRSDYWEWNGTAWQQIVPSNPLNLSKPFRLVYAPQRGQVLAVTGEETANGPPMVIRGWNGTNWVPVNSSGPMSRAEAWQVAWDANRGVLVMFGSPFGAETWEWNGTVWQLRGTGGPLPREGHRMVYDEGRQRVVLCGGLGLIGGTVLNDTWEWDGAVWVERFGIPAPQIQQASAIAYDRARQRVVLHGGYWNGNDTGAVYEYDGQQWQQRVAVDGPFAVTFASMAYMPTAGRMLLFGGLSGATAQRTRTLRFVQGTLATSQPHQPGCAGPAGVPSLQPQNGSRPVLGAPFALRFQNLPSSPLNLVFAAFGTSDQTWGGLPLPLDLSPLGFAGCTLYVEPMILEPLSNLGGFADWTIAMPASPGLDGFEFFLQGFVLTPGFNTGGGVLSASRRCVAGVL